MISISKKTMIRFEEFLKFNLIFIENLKVCKFHFWLDYFFSLLFFIFLIFQRSILVINILFAKPKELKLLIEDNY